MRSSITISLKAFRDPNAFVYVTHFSEVEYLHSIAERVSSGLLGLGTNVRFWPTVFWTIPWIERFYKTVENERQIKVLW